MFTFRLITHCHCVTPMRTDVTTSRWKRRNRSRFLDVTARFLCDVRFSLDVAWIFIDVVVLLDFFDFLCDVTNNNNRYLLLYFFPAPVLDNGLQNLVTRIASIHDIVQTFVLVLDRGLFPEEMLQGSKCLISQDPIKSLG